MLGISINTLKNHITVKEYYLIEVSEYETLNDRCIPEKNGSNVQNEILKSTTLNKDAILDIFNDLQEKNRKQAIKE